MQVIRCFEPVSGPTSVALGLFDGVHLGHQSVIRATKNDYGFIQGVLTFDISKQKPSRKKENSNIQSMQDRLDSIQELGIDVCWLPEFGSIASMSPIDFIENILVAKLNAAIICCGTDFRFGVKASGDVCLLQEICKNHGIEVRVLPEYLDEGKPVSSTRIRLALAEGKMEEVNRLMGRKYAITGEIIHGRHLGTQMHYPTLNQKIDPLICQPRYGVYVSSVFIDGVQYPGITNIGVKPTLNGTTPLAETHVVGLDRNLYGKTVTVLLYHFVRGEKKFSNIEELFAQIARDTDESIKYFQK